MTLNPPAGTNKYSIYEFAHDSSSASSALYSESGLEIGYGYNDRDGNNNRIKTFYGGADSSNAALFYGGVGNSAGMHGIHLNRPLAEGEEINITWYNGYQLVIYEDHGTTKVKKRNGGSYSEIGKWLDEDGISERTALLFDDDMYTKRFDKIETKSFEEF